MANSKPLIFLVDDDNAHNQMLNDHLSENMKVTIRSFTSGEAALAEISLRPDIVILDYYLDSQDKSARNGIKILQDIVDIDSSIYVIMLSGQDKIGIAVDTIKYGAYDYVVKNQSAFIRTQKIIQNIEQNRALRRSARRIKAWNGVIIGIFLAIVAFSLIVYFFFPELVPERRNRLNL